MPGGTASTSWPVRTGGAPLRRLLGTFCSLSGALLTDLEVHRGQGTGSTWQLLWPQLQGEAKSLSPELGSDSGLAVVGMDGGQAVNAQCDVGIELSGKGKEKKTN